jgi:virginiamycin B lyase
VFRALARASLAALALSAVAIAPAQGQAALDDPELQEWLVPYEDSRPRDPMVAPDGRVWFCGQAGGYIAVLDPETEEFIQYDLEGVRPHNLIIDPEGMVWYAGNAATGDARAHHIGKLDPATGEIEKFWMPDERASDPHTLIFDSRGDIWFTVQGGNFIGKLTVDTGQVRLVESIPGRAGRRGAGSSRPYGIVMDSNDRPWIALFNTNHIATVNPETFELETFELPENALPRRIAITSDDMIWYGDWTRGTLGKLDPATGAVQEFALPSGEGSRPYAMLADDSDRLWIFETGVRPNNLVGFDPVSGEFFSQTQPESGGGTVRHMYFDAETNSIWFGADTNTVGQIRLPPRRRAITD